METINFNQQLDELFKSWMESYPEDQRHLFCQDGLMLKTDKSVDVNERWQKSRRRVAFILKDNPDGWGNDTRLWLRDAKNADINGNRFLTTLAEILYALLHLDATEDSRLDLSYTKIHGLLHHEVADHFVNVDPFAFIEAKKLAGGETVSQREMGEAMERDCEYLKKELDILRPNIIVCFDRYNSQFNFITRRYIGDKEAQVIAYDYTDESGRKLIGQRCCLWYYPDDNVVVIRSYHPSYGALWKTFERVVSPFHAFLKRHPEVKF